MISNVTAIRRLTIAGFVLVSSGRSAEGVTQRIAGDGDNGSQPFNPAMLTSRFEFWLSLLVLAFGTIVVVVQYLLVRRKDFDSNDVVRVFGVSLIVVGTLFLIAAGFEAQQIASGIGLFGTLAGYLLGKTKTKQTNKKDDI